jgi:hypothetical protein
VVDERKEQVAAALGRSVDQLVELDRRPLPLLLVDGTYETVTVRDRDSGQIHNVTVEVISGEVADPQAMRRQDSDLATLRASALSAELRELLLRHPELASVRVWVTEDRQAPRQLLTMSARDVARLAEDTAVLRIDLAEDPVVVDAD